jgi:hypothetical protein
MRTHLAERVRRTSTARLSFVSLLLVLAGESVAHAEERPTRSVWVGPTYQVLFSDTFEPSSRHGLGASATYDFHVGPTFDVGLTLAYRLYPGSRATQQLGYGAILRHFFEGRSGSAVSHDTRLGAGAVVRRGAVPLFVGLAFHYSRLQQFDVESRWIPYADLQIGWVHAF